MLIYVLSYTLMRIFATGIYANLCIQAVVGMVAMSKLVLQCFAHAARCCMCLLL